MNFKLANKEIIHFIDIGVIGMSGLALIMKGQGFKVQGSDINNNKNIDRLKKEKIKIYLDQSKKNLNNATIVVISSAIKKTNPELVEAKNRDINVDILYVGEPTNDNKIELKSKINEYDCTIFFARIGDQDRFENISFKNKRVMCYVKNNKSLASSFGCTHHHAMLEIKEVINNLIFKSNKIEITCPLGTKVSGKISGACFDP